MTTKTLGHNCAFKRKAHKEQECGAFCECNCHIHLNDCATSAAAVSDQFAIMGCTCKNKNFNFKK